MYKLVWREEVREVMHVFGRNAVNIAHTRCFIEHFIDYRT